MEHINFVVSLHVFRLIDIWKIFQAICDNDNSDAIKLIKVWYGFSFWSARHNILMWHNKSLSIIRNNDEIFVRV